MKTLVVVLDCFDPELAKALGNVQPLDCLINNGAHTTKSAYALLTGKTPDMNDVVAFSANLKQPKILFDYINNSKLILHCPILNRIPANSVFVKGRFASSEAPIGTENEIDKYPAELLDIENEMSAVEGEVTENFFYDFQDLQMRVLLDNKDKEFGFVWCYANDLAFHKWVKTPDRWKNVAAYIVASVKKTIAKIGAETTIIFSDHGCEMGTHGHKPNGFYVINSPLPHEAKPARIIDMFPTILTAEGISIPKEAEGRSLIHG
jgi:hypothetical protein